MRTLLLATTLLSAACAAQAASVTLYTNEAAYLAAIAAPRVAVDFAGSPAASVSGASFSPAVTFGSCTDHAAPGSCGTSVWHNSDAISDLGGSASPNGVASLAWRFDLTDVYAFAFHYVSGGITAVNLVDVGLNLNVIDTSTASGFIGLISDEAFYGGIGVNAVFAGGGNDRYFIDDFRIDAAGHVPEPAALLLALGALGAAMGARRRR
jgi:hypothetical protein